MKKLTGHIQALACAVIFSFHYILAKEVTPLVDLIAFASARGIVGGLLLIAINYRYIARICDKKTILQLTLICLFSFVFNQMLFLGGIIRTTSSQAAMLSNFIPVTTYLVALVFKNRSFSASKIVLLLVQFLALILYFYWQYQVDLSTNFLGNAMILANVFSLAIGLNLVEKSALKNLPSSLMTGSLLLLAGIILGALQSFDYTSLQSYMASSNRAVFILFFEVVVATSFAYYLNFDAARRIGAAYTSQYAFFQVPLTSGFVFLLFGDTISTATIALFFLVFICNMIDWSLNNRRFFGRH